ncbi:hypothetical protein OUZ56_025550 [Daphnia magna]|uniref:Uncharacterized protein n=1 Tax=Daphnia magna TaxID=35525 RepID=A0ABQ9ZK99_9CRUS|nr:hypothetical protein OUZ56_025550 [Daphnia magna]
MRRNKDEGKDEESEIHGRRCGNHRRKVNDDCRRFRDLRLSKSTKSIYWKRSTDIKSLPSPRYGVDVDVIRDEDKKRLTECYDYKLAVQSSGFQKT